MKQIIVGTLFATLLGLSGCATTAPTQTSLQIQAYQTKEFDVGKDVAFNASLSVFQDLGYIVASASKETGFITAASPTGSKTNIWEAVNLETSSGQTKATAFVEEIRPNFSTVRLNFVNTKHRSGIYGQTEDRDTAVLDPRAYQIAFDKIGDAIFIRMGTHKTATNSSPPSNVDAAASAGKHLTYAGTLGAPTPALGPSTRAVPGKVIVVSRDLAATFGPGPDGEGGLAVTSVISYIEIQAAYL